MMATDALSQLVDQIVDGKYRLEGLLGRGGMGAVFRATHLGTDRVVALKVIAPALADEPEYLARFSREARACGRLRHPGIVDVTDFGIAHHNGRPLAYLVMEFLDGCTLAEVLREEAQPPLPWVIDVLEQVCSCVEEAHRQGILHRDLKPENIWLEPDRRGGFSVKILDFGLAKLDSPTEPRHTPAGYAEQTMVRASEPGLTFAGAASNETIAAAPGATMAGDAIEQTIEPGSGGAPALSDADASAMSSVAGTPAYMSPEQTRGDLVDARADVYSLGVLAYRMIAGRLPFEGSVREVLAAQVERDPPPLRQIRPDVHDDAARLVASAMSKNPAERPASAGVFGNMLAAQLEPPVAFFRRATLLLVDRAGPFFRAGLLAFAPLIIGCTLAASWELAHLLVGVPALGASGAALVVTVLFALALVAQTAMGAMPIFVLHAVAAPLRPIDERALLRAYAPRLRRWARAMTPMLIGMVTWLIGFVLFVWVMGLLAPWARQFSVPIRLMILLPLLLVPFAAAWLALRRKGLGFRQTGFLGAILLIEDVPFERAAQRSAELMAKSGGIRNSIQKWYLVAIALVSGVLGAFIGARGFSGTTPTGLVPLTPVIALLMTVLVVVNAVISSLIYLSARRATGESLERVFADFEQASLPPDRAQLAQHERFREQLVSQTGGRSQRSRAR